MHVMAMEGGVNELFSLLWLARQFLRKDYWYIWEHLSECILEHRLSFKEDTIAYFLLVLNEYARGNY